MQVYTKSYNACT